MKALAMCALAGIDPVGVINAGPDDRDLLLEAAARVHAILEEANRKAAKK